MMTESFKEHRGSRAGGEPCKALAGALCDALYRPMGRQSLELHELTLCEIERDWTP